MSKSRLKSKLSEIGSTIKDDRIYTGQVWTLFMLTLFIMLIQGAVNVPGILDGPQFTYDATYNLTPKADFENFIESIIKGDPWLKFCYYAFFVVDFVWAGLLLRITWKFVKRRFLRSVNDADDTAQDNLDGKEKIWIKVLSVIFISAYVADFVENILYLSEFRYEEIVSTVKMALYATSGLLFLFALLSDINDKVFPVLGRFFRSSVLSLIIVAVLGMFLPTAEQVNSIIVDLYIKPLNLILLLVLSPLFAVVLAHYPSYFGKGEDLKLRNWFMAAPKVIGAFGVVFYRYNMEFASKSGKIESRVNFLYRALGIAYFAALFYIVAYTSQVNFSWMLKMSTLSLALFIAGCGFLYYIKQKKDEWYSTSFQLIKAGMSGFYDGDYRNASEEAEIVKKRKMEGEDAPESTEADPRIEKAAGELRRHMWPFLRLCMFTFFLHIVLFGLLFGCRDCGYSEITVVISLICIALQMFCFVYYRAYRSLLRFTFYNANSDTILNSFSNLIDTNTWWNDMKDDAKDKHIAKQQADVKKFFGKYANHFTGNHWLIKIFVDYKLLRLGALSNNVVFLRINALFGIANFLFLLALNLKSSLSTNLSTVLVILLSLFFYYGIAVVFIKNRIYYRQTNAKGRTRFTQITFFLFVLFFIFFGLTRFRDNKLFTLPLTPRQSDTEVSLKMFTENLKGKNRRLYVGCYGGGMKSNAWTMAVLEELYRKDSSIISDMVGISGASGGTMGIVNWFALLKGYPGLNNQKRKQKIKEVATENVLALDATHILGRDSFNYLFNPFKSAQGSDRSSKAMQLYANLSKDTEAIEKNFDYRQYWKRLYKKYQKEFPIFIANTTNVQGNHGMAVSVRVDNDTVSSFLYQNADNILEIDGALLKEVPNTQQSLGYYDAISTSNRFPILSPAAKIETKGHFNDGGIYENSGLLSVYKLYRAIDFIEKDTIQPPQQRNIFISIVNDKNLYLREVVKKLQCRASKINYYGELSIVLRSVASTEMMPIYIKTELDRLEKLSEDGSLEYHSIYLPHTLTIQDIKNAIGETLLCKIGSNSDKELYGFVKKHNEVIEDLMNPKCKYGATPIVEPAVSRSNAQPAFDFMLNMLEHQSVKEAIADVLE